MNGTEKSLWNDPDEKIKGRYEIGETVGSYIIVDGPWHDPVTDGPYYLVHESRHHPNVRFPMTEALLTERGR